MRHSLDSVLWVHKELAGKSTESAAAPVRYGESSTTDAPFRRKSKCTSSGSGGETSTAHWCTCVIESCAKDTAQIYTRTHIDYDLHYVTCVPLCMHRCEHAHARSVPCRPRTRLFHKLDSAEVVNQQQTWRDHRCLRWRRPGRPLRVRAGRPRGVSQIGLNVQLPDRMVKLLLVLHSE